MPRKREVVVWVVLGKFITEAFRKRESARRFVKHKLTGDHLWPIRIVRCTGTLPAKPAPKKGGRK